MASERGAARSGAGGLLSLAESGARLETVLESMMATLESQRAEIAALREELNQRTRVSETAALAHDIHAKMHGLEVRLEAVERAVVVGPRSTVSGVVRSGASAAAATAGAAGDWTIGQHVQWLTERADALHLGVQAGATRADLASAEETLRAELADSVGRLQRDKAGVAVTRACVSVRLARVVSQVSGKGTAVDESAQPGLEGSMQSMREQFATLEVLVTRKADVSALVHIEAAAAQLREEVEQRAALTDRVTRAESLLRDHTRALDGEVRRGARVAELLEQVSASLARKADAERLERLEAEAARTVDALGALDGRVHRTDEAWRAAVAETRREADAALGALRASVRGAEEALRGALARLDGFARREETWTRSENEALEAAVRTLAAEVEARALSSSLDAVHARVQTLDRRTGRLGEEVQVALDFVDWYARRGEAYEFNASALERHMNDLAVGNAGAVSHTRRRGEGAGRGGDGSGGGAGSGGGVGVGVGAGAGLVSSPRVEGKRDG